MDINLEKNKLFKKFNISVEKVSSNLETGEKEFLIYWLLYGYELARKNFLRGNLTASSYACGLVSEDSKVYFGVNFNNTRNEISSICAERLAILNLFNSKVEEYSPEEKFDYKIKYILMSSYRSEGAFWVDKITPCADCLSWFNTGANLSADTKIVSLKKRKDGGIFLDVQPLEHFLPLRNLFYQTCEAENPKVIRLGAAFESKIDDTAILKLYKETKKAYKSNPFAKTSNQNIGAGVLAGGEIFTGVKIDFSKRWFTEPLMTAAIKAVEKFGPKTKIDAVCYVGEEYTITEANKKVKDGLISLKTLGRLNTRFTDDKTLVITGSKEGIRAYTIGDYMPGEHKFIHNYEIN